MEVEEKWWCLLCFSESEHSVHTLSRNLFSLLRSSASLALPWGVNLVLVQVLVEPVEVDPGGAVLGPGLLWWYVGGVRDEDGLGRLLAGGLAYILLPV